MKTQTLLIALLLSTLLWGCKTAPVERVVTVKVPVGVPCDPPAVVVPYWPLDTLDPSATIWEKTTATLAELDLRIGYELQLNAALDSCRASAVAK